MENEVILSEELREQERKEIRELNAWLSQFHRNDKTVKTFRSSELGGHMELKKGKKESLIGPSEEEVRDLLRSCGKKLGINYVAR